MPTITTLQNTNLVAARTLQAASGYLCKIGRAPDDEIWSGIASTVLNGNTFLIERGPGNTQVTIKASSLFYTTNTSLYAGLTLLADKPITSSITPPPGARTNSGHYFFSEATGFGETLTLLAGYYNHIYFVHASPQPEFGVIATTSAAAPDSFFSTFIAGTGTQTAPDLNPRQAYCRVDGTGAVVSLVTFPRMVGTVATVAPNSGPSFVDWRGNAAADPNTNAIQASFLIAAGVGTGLVGEVAILSGADIIAHKALSPQILKDEDVDLTVIWSLVVGQPEALIP